MDNSHVFYIIYQLDKAIGDLEPGYYKYVYSLSGEQQPRACECSKDRFNWEPCTRFATLNEFQEFFENLNPKPLKIDREDYVETIEYRGLSVPIFLDDYGQCFYCIFGNKPLAFGSFQDNYESEVKDLIDLEIDGRPSDLQDGKYHQDEVTKRDIE